jgi:hypothetical protein
LLTLQEEIELVCQILSGELNAKIGGAVIPPLRIIYGPVLVDAPAMKERETSR